MKSTTSLVGSAMMWSVLAKAVKFLLSLASSVIVVRSLGDHDYGVLSLVRTILLLVMILSGGGMGQALLKFLPALRVEKGAVGTRALLRTVILVNVSVWVVLVVAVYLLRHAIEGLFNFEELGLLVSAAVALSFFEMFFTVVSQVLNARYDTMLLSIASIASHVVYIGGLLVLLPTGWGILAVVAAAAAGYLVACVMLLGRLRAAFPKDDPDDSGYRIGGARLAKFSIPFAAVGLLNFVVWRQSETVFLAHFRTAAETGYFELAYRIPQTMLEFVPGAVWPLVMAGISEVYSKNAENLRLAVDRYYRMLFILCAPLSVAGMVLGGKTIPVLFGAEMLPAAVPTQAFFGIFTLSFFGTPLSMTLYVIEKTHVNLLVYLCLAVFNVALDLVLIPRYGVPGAIIPVAVVIFISPLVYRVVLNRYVSGVRIPLRFIGKCFLASSPVLLLLPFLGFIDGPPELVAACTAAVVLALLGFKLARVMGKEELDMMRAVPVPMAGRLLKFLSS